MTTLIDRAENFTQPKFGGAEKYLFSTQKHIGKFLGHVFPGSYFVVLSIWWCYAAYRNYFKSKCNGTSYRSTTWFRLEHYPNLPLEIIFKLLYKIIAISTGIKTGFNNDGDFDYLLNGQHLSIYTFFTIQTLVEILQFYKFPSIPPHAQYFTGILQFFFEGLIFHFHIHKRSIVDVVAHQLLVVAIACCCISVLIEMFVRNKVMATLVRGYWVLIQGTWLCHVGFILYPPLDWMKRWSQDDHKETVLVLVYFTWHCAVNFCVVLLIGSLVSLRYRRDLAMTRREKSLGKNVKCQFMPLDQFDSDDDAI